MDLKTALSDKLGLASVTFKHNLATKDLLFREAIANDRGRVTPRWARRRAKGVPDQARRRSARWCFYTDPTCTGRPVNDTFHGRVAGSRRHSVVEGQPARSSAPDKFGGLLRRRVVEYLNPRAGPPCTYRTCLPARTPAYAVPYRFVGEYATHAMFAHNMFPENLVAGVS